MLRCIKQLVAVLGFALFPAVGWAATFGLDVGVSWGYGSIGNSNGYYPSRSTTSLTILLFPNFNRRFPVSKYFDTPFTGKLGLLGGYHFLGQFANPEDFVTADGDGVKNADGADLRGRGGALGLGVGVDIKSFSIVGSLDFFGWHTNPPFIPATDITYGALRGGRLLLGYQIKPMFSISLNLEHASFGNLAVSGQSKSIRDNMLEMNTIGIGSRISY
ncbi:hypothetical protein WDW86_20660 [Bdellovibrionota bacterium FG-2]